MIEGSNRETAHISATMIGGCRRKTRLQMDNEWIGNPDQMFPGWRGTVAHLAMEEWPDPDCVYERRFEIRFPEYPVPFTGQVDKLDIIRRTITDFKTKKDKSIPRTPEYEHVYQLNCYRYLVKHGWPQRSFGFDPKSTAGTGPVRRFMHGTPAGIEVETLQLVYFSMEKVQIFHAELIPDEEIEDYIRSGLAEITAAEVPAIPEDLNPYSHRLCTDWCPVNALCRRLHEKGK
jgi:hypothetical protein